MKQIQILMMVCFISVLASCATGMDRGGSTDIKYEPTGVGDEQFGPIPPEFNLKRDSDEIALPVIDDGNSSKPGQRSKVKVDLVTLSNETTAPDDKISLNLSGTSVTTAIRTLAEAGGINFIIHPSIENFESVDLALNNVSWFKALETLVRSNSLVASVDGRDIFANNQISHGITKSSPVIISTYDYFAKLQSQRISNIKTDIELTKQKRRQNIESALTKTSEEGVGIAIRSYRFRYADPVEALAYLNELYGTEEKRKDKEKYLGDGAAGSVDTKGNKSEIAGEVGSGLTFALYDAENMITIKAHPHRMERIMKLIKDIDVKPRQVYIEARIVEIQRSSIDDLGIQWGGHVYRTTNQTFPSGIGVFGGSNSGDGSPDVVSLPPDSAVDPNTGDVVANPAGAVVGIALGGVTGSTLLHAKLFALEREGVSRTLSNPKIMTVNGGLASIKSGKEIPYQASSAEKGPNVRFKEAVIALSVKALIMKDDKIRLNINVKKDEVDNTLSVQGTPAIKKKEISTNVVVENGGSAALGGMFEKEDGTLQDRVPWFHKIPGIGWLFKNRRNIDKRLELLVFITPAIVDK